MGEGCPIDGVAVKEAAFMQPNPLPGMLVALLFLLFGVMWTVRRSGIFHGFLRGFWNGFFHWLFMGSNRPPGSRTSLGGCFIMMAWGLLFLLLIGLVGLIGH
jgi:hypothetical protein